MADIFHLVGFRPFDRMALRREERREAKHIPGTRRAVRAVAGRPQVSTPTVLCFLLEDSRTSNLKGEASVRPTFVEAACLGRMEIYRYIYIGALVQRYSPLPFFLIATSQLP